MAGSFSDYLELELLDHVFGGGDYTRPATVYIALLTDSNTQAQRDAGTVTEVDTGDWTNYARLAVTNNSTNFPAASGTTATKSNGAAITFSAATIPSGTVVVTAIAIYDASTAGNLMGHGDLAVPKTMSDNDIFSIPVGDLDITLA
jgi:hypothetical protein